MTDDEVENVWKSLKFDQGRVFRSPDEAAKELRGMLVRACMKQAVGCSPGLSYPEEVEPVKPLGYVSQGMLNILKGRGRPVIHVAMHMEPGITAIHPVALLLPEKK